MRIRRAHSARPAFSRPDLIVRRYLAQTRENSNSLPHVLKKIPAFPPRIPPAARSDNSGMFSLLGTAGTMGLHMVSGPIVGGVLGWLADKWLDSWPVGAAVGLLLGVAAGFRNVWVDARYLIRGQNDTSTRNKEEKDAPVGRNGGRRS